MNKLFEKLAELLNDAGLVLTFDRFRDLTKGCGSHCRAWERTKSKVYCANHIQAIESGEYVRKEDRNQ